MNELDPLIAIGPALAAEAELLLNSPLLSATFMVGVNKLIEKKRKFLTVLGIKPVSQVSAAHWVGDPSKLEIVADDTDALKKLFDQLGLSYHLFGDESELQVVVSMDAKLVDQFIHAPDDENVTRGKLPGYPATAIEGAETRDWARTNKGFSQRQVCVAIHFFESQETITRTSLRRFAAGSRS